MDKKMKASFFIITCLSVVFLLLPRRQSPPTSSATLTANVNATKKEPHIETAQQFFDAAQTIAQRTSDTQAEEVIHFLLGKASIGFMGADGKYYTSDPLQPLKPMWVVTLLPSDEHIGDIWERYAHQASVATFDTRTFVKPTLILKALARYSPTFLGLTLLHEGEHARRFEQKVQQVRIDWCREESVVHDFENRLITKLGGLPFVRLLEGEARKFQSHMSETNGTLRYPMTLDSDPMSQVEVIFGQSASEREFNLRSTLMYIHIAFYAIEHDTRVKNVREEKASFYCSFVESNQDPAHPF